MSQEIELICRRLWDTVTCPSPTKSATRTSVPLGAAPKKSEIERITQIMLAFYRNLPPATTSHSANNLSCRTNHRSNPAPSD